MEEESTSWVRRTKFSPNIVRSGSSREPSSQFSARDSESKAKAASSISSSDAAPILPKPSSKLPICDLGPAPQWSSSTISSCFRPDGDPRSKTKLASKSQCLISELKPKGPYLDSCVLPDPSVHSDRNLGSKTKSPSSRLPSISSKPESDPRLNPKPKEYADSSDFSFHPGGGSGLNTKYFTSNISSASSIWSITDTHPQKPNTSKPKQRSVSPLPTAILSDVFKEAKSIKKRFSTPPPSRKGSDKGVFGKLLSRGGNESHRSTSPLPPNTGLHQQLSSMKAPEKAKNRKEISWTRYFDYGGGRVTAVETTEEWMVDLSKLYIGLRFAAGGHSRLYHGIYKDQPVAVKIIRQPDDDENGGMAARLEKQFTREVTHLSHLYHRNVIKLAGACKKPPVFFIVTEYLSGGSLRAFLHKLDHKSLPLQNLVAIALDIARGMEYIHSQGVVHRDLKPENILFDENFCVKIADFGIACEEAYCDALADDPGTYRWMAPEMIKHKSYGRKVDVYSFGLLLWEMVTGTIPYEDMTPIQAAFAVVDKNLRPIIPTDCPTALRALIEQCWALNPEKRPEFWQIVKVLEQFESAIARNGTLDLLQNLTCQDHKKRLLHWIQKLKPLQSDGTGPPMPRLL